MYADDGFREKRRRGDYADLGAVYDMGIVNGISAYQKFYRALFQFFNPFFIKQYMVKESIHFFSAQLD